MRCRRAFTLVELLVVVGIITILVALLLPAIRGARESGRRVQCASNLRQLAHAFNLYANDNRGWFPCAAGVNAHPYLIDWIHWQGGRDLSDSAVAPYLGRPTMPEVFRCPSDDWTSRQPGRLPSWAEPTVFLHLYRYSYCMNSILSSYPWGPGFASRINRVRQSSSIVLLLEVNERDLLTAEWTPFINSAQLGNTYMWRELLSNRHDAPRSPERWLPFYLPANSHPDSRGNVAFVDGHVDFIPRRVAHDPRSVLPDHPWATQMTWATTPGW